MKGGLLVLSAPSGTGKTTVARALVEGPGPYRFSVSATTRRPRPGEVDGRDYHFVSEAEFKRMVAQDELLEWAHVHGSNYGTLVAEVDRIARAHSFAILDIDIQGAIQVRERVPDAILVFLLPPSGAALVERLAKRGTDQEAEVRARLETALDELDSAEHFDYCLVNRVLAETVDAVGRIAQAEGHRVSRLDDLGGTIGRLKREIEESARHAAL